MKEAEAEVVTAEEVKAGPVEVPPHAFACGGDVVTLSTQDDGTEVNVVSVDSPEPPEPKKPR